MLSNARVLKYTAIAQLCGIRNAYRAITEADKVGIGPALAIAILEQESGGKNEFGHDPTIFVGAGSVTKGKYLAYRALRRRSGNKLMQGVGPLQLTWWATQDAADAAGGCWKPRINLRTGFQILAHNVKTYGTRDGIRRYNGSGPAAEAYAEKVLERRAKWRQRFGMK